MCSLWMRSGGFLIRMVLARDRHKKRLATTWLAVKQVVVIRVGYTHKPRADIWLTRCILSDRQTQGAYTPPLSEGETLLTRNLRCLHSVPNFNSATCKVGREIGSESCTEC